ncbi:MAG: DUF2752 domain-containing protein [Nitrospiraceae bacterium]|nr:DUF2752 domain-containing protein [Nitrospiraceae bacterium]
MKRIPERLVAAASSGTAVIYGMIAMAAIIAARFLPVERIAPSCAFKGLTGLACPTCGATRSLVHLAEGDVPGAVGLNPLFSVMMLFAVLLFFLGVLSRLGTVPRSSRPQVSASPAQLRFIVLALFMMNWAYLIVHL